MKSVVGPVHIHVTQSAGKICVIMPSIRDGVKFKVPNLQEKQENKQ